MTAHKMLRRSMAATLLALGVGVGSLIGTSVVGRADDSTSDASENASRAAELNAISTEDVLAGVSGARHEQARVTLAGSTFTVDAFEWTTLENGEYGPVLGQDQDERLADCGRDAWPDSMGVYGPNGGFCISSIDFSDHESVAAANLLARRLSSGTEYSDAEVNALRLWTLAGYADPDSKAAAELLAQFDAAFDALTDEERDHLFG